MFITLKDLRSIAAMAQFSPREVNPAWLRLIETSANLAGETMISVDATSAVVIESQPRQAQ